jgi:heat shock protein HtpX
MYLYDFFRTLPRKSNIPVIIYLLLNICLIGAVAQGLFLTDYPYWVGLLVGFDLYVASLLIALSPVGEFILRLQTGCRKITREEDIRRIQPIFDEVYNRARAIDPTIPPDVKFFVCDEVEPNAFATGRKTVCVTRGLLKQSDEEIKGVLGHEFGHLAHHDTDRILVVSIGNLIVNLIFLGLRIFLDFVVLIIAIASAAVSSRRSGGLYYLMGYFQSVIVHAIIGALMWVWTKIGVLLVMKTSRENEFEADAFASQLGYGRNLAYCLHNIAGEDMSFKNGLFANLESSHPDTGERINRLKNLSLSH